MCTLFIILKLEKDKGGTCMMMDTNKLFKDVVNSEKLQSISTLEIVTVTGVLLELLEENNFYLVKEEFD